MEISEVITKLVQFGKVERPVTVKLYYRNPDGDVLKCEVFPVEAVFSHDKEAVIVIEHSCMGKI